MQPVRQYTHVVVTHMGSRNSLKTDENSGIVHDIHFVKDAFKTKTKNSENN